MKKFTKILICFLAFFALVLVGCNDEPKETEEERYIRIYDTNANGVVDYWEAPFETPLEVKHTALKDAIAINTIDDFKLIGKYDLQEGAQPENYVLTSDLDFRDEKDFESAFDLKGGYLFGNGKQISNFRISNQIDNNGSYSSNINHILFKNAKGIYDLNVLMGEISNDQKGNMRNFALTQDVSELDNIRMKGKYEISVFDIRGDVLNIGFLTLNSEENSSTIISKITNCSILGGINFNEKELAGETSCNIVVGGIMPKLNYGSSIKNTNVDLDINNEGIASLTIGAIVGEANGFIEDCTSKLKFGYSSTSSENSYIGSLAGKALTRAEIKNCIADIDFASNTKSSGQIYSGKVSIGGLCGASMGSLFYNETTGNISVEGVETLSVGGMVGTERDSYILRNISKVNISIQTVANLYSAGFVGSAYGGILESNISLSKIDLKLNYQSDGEIENRNSANLGLLFFNANNFLKLEGEEDFKSDTGLDKAEGGIESVSPQNVPGLLKNIIKEKFTIQTAGFEGDLGATDQTINYGGFWWWIKKGDTNRNLQPKLFKESNCNGSTLKINNSDKSNLASFFLNNASKSWLANRVIDLKNDLKKNYGLLDTEINTRDEKVTDFYDLHFYNGNSQKGSFYESLDQSVNNNDDGKFNFKPERFEELKSVIRYAKNYNELTFILDTSRLEKVEDEASIDDTDAFTHKLQKEIDSLVFYVSGGEEETQTYYIYTKAQWELQDHSGEEVSSKDVFTNTFGLSDMEIVMISVILEKAGGKLEIQKNFEKPETGVVGNNDGYISLFYSVDTELKSTLIRTIKDGGFYRVTVIL